MDEKKKYQVTISFELDEAYMEQVPAHREYISSLINKEIIDHYAVSLESRRTWITFNAESKEAVDEYLAGSPLFKFWIYEIDELYVLDGLTYRLPHVQLN
jgi:muconolactone delta-isomerase